MSQPNPTPSAHLESIEDIILEIYWHGFNHKAAPGSTIDFDPDEYAAKLKALLATQVNEALLAEVRAIYKELSSDDPEFNRAYFKVRIHELQSLQDKVK